MQTAGFFISFEEQAKKSQNKNNQEFTMHIKKASRWLLISGLLLTGIFAVYLLVPEQLPSVYAQADQSEADIQEGSTVQNNHIQNVNMPILTQQSAKPAQGADTVIISETPIERIRAIQNKTELHQALLEDHQQFTRYPEYNQRFDSAETDPVLARYAVDERSTENPEDGSQLTIWSDKKYYLKGDRAKLYATLRDQEGHAIQTQFLAQVIYNEKTNLKTVSFEDTNQDGVYEYDLALSAEDGQNWQAGVYKVLIINKANPVADALTFIISQPDIELSGEFRDSVSEKGELLVEAEVVVATENRYYLQASLYSANQIAIGATQQSLQLSPGKQWVTLVFDGGLIRDSGETSPFLLKHLSLAKVSLPIQRAPMIHTDYFTREYALAKFKGAGHSQEQ